MPYAALSGRLASSTEANTWCTFDEAVAASVGFSGIGFVLTDDDPYTFIDLDDPYAKNADGSFKYTAKQAEGISERQVRIFNECVSYTEFSPSGKGLHIICRGAVPHGRNRSGVEIYSSERYMTMTGDTYRDLPIANCNGSLNAVWEQLAGNSKTLETFFTGGPEREADSKIMQRALDAENGLKFSDLHEGRWQNHYKSQSEADLAYINIIAFYTQNKQQIFRMFLASDLGKRDKAKRLDYFKWNVGLAFDRMLPPIDMEELQNTFNEALAASKKKESKIVKVIEAAQSESKNPYTVPPGLVGRLAQFIYDAAPRPVPEIALAGAIGILAGIVGRSYNVSGTGLNQYVLLLAPTGTGKEAIASGADKIMAAVQRTVPAAIDFIGPAEISSAQALAKHFSKVSSSFFSVVGEFGIALQQMSAEHASPHMLGLRRMLLDLYNKSGEGKVLRPTIYSDAAKNIASVAAPNFVLIGESTPERFYENLREGLITEGLLPRFTIIEYNGKRPELNENHQRAEPSFELVEQMATLCAHSLMLNSQNKAIHVQLSLKAKEIFDRFNLHCDREINNSEREVRRHLWNRAHVKALKLASLLAIGNYPYQPEIDEESANWAISLISYDVRALLFKFDAGEIGVDNDETKQLAKVIQMIREWMLRPWSELEIYKVGTSTMHMERVVPYSYLHKRLSSMIEFKKDRMGAAFSIKRSVKTLMERGDIQEVPRTEMMMKFKTHASSYMIAVPRVFGIG